MSLIDTHCHLTFEGLAEDVAAVIERSKAAGVVGWITVGTDPEHNRKAVELAERFENMYAAIAIHPHDAKTLTTDILKELRELAQHNKVVAVGETGLDFHYNFSIAAAAAGLFHKTPGNCSRNESTCHNSFKEGV